MSGEMLVRPSVRPSIYRTRAEPEQIRSIWPIIGLFEPYFGNFGLILAIFGPFLAYFSPNWPVMGLF